MKMKKILLVLTAIALSFTFVGCNNVSKESEELFIKFQDGNESALISENFKYDDTFGIEKIYDGTIPEIAKSFLYDWYYDDVDPSNYFVSFTKQKYEDGYDYALFTIHYDEMNDVSLNMLIKNNNGKLEIVFEDGAWARRTNTFYKNGLVSASGSNGAASHSSKLMYVDKEGKITTIYDLDAEGVYMTYLLPEELTDEENYTTVNTYDLGNGNKYAIIYDYDEDFNVVSASEEVYNKVCDKISDEYVICEDEAEVDKYIEEYANELGVSLKNLENKMY